MPFLTGSYITYETSGTNLVQTPAAIISDGDFTHTSTAGGVDNNILENNEPHNSVTIGINVNSLWVGKVYHMGKEFHVFELVPAQGTITHLICSVDDAADFGGAGNTANYPNNVPISSFDTADHAHCFGPGTAIATPTGETAVEALKIGDLVTTASGKSVPVKWIGHQARDHLSLMAASAEPVRIAANALGNGLPRRDLVVSADHGMIVDGLVINASALVNGHSIAFMRSAEIAQPFAFYHVETENHDVILAEGAESETYLDIPGRAAFDNYDEYLDLYGAEKLIREMPLPRVTSRRMLPDHIRARLGIDDSMALVEPLVA